MNVVTASAYIVLFDDHICRIGRRYDLRCSSGSVFKQRGSYGEIAKQHLSGICCLVAVFLIGLPGVKVQAEKA